MFYPKRRPERMMMKYNKLYLIIIVVCHVQRSYKANIIPGQNPFDQLSDLILIDDSRTLETTFNLVDDIGVNTESAFGFLPIPFLWIALLMTAMGMMTMPSSVTSRTTPVAPRPDVQTTVPVTVQSFLATQAATQKTPCIPTNCPSDYMLLADQTDSQNCYFYGGNTEKVWSDALKACTLTPGAYLWRPNTKAEADAVRNKFSVGDDEHIWTGANSPNHDDNYVFANDNAALPLLNLPFGVLDVDSKNGDECIDIELDTQNGPTDHWEWEKQDCSDDIRYICELPRKTCP